MASQRQLDRKARTAVTAAVVLLLAGPLLLVGKHVTTKIGEQSEQAFHPGNDQLVTLRDGTTMLVRNSSVGSRIADWFERETKGEQTFQVGNANFVPGSAMLSHDGWEHVTQFATMLNAHHNVRAVILFSSFHGSQPTVQLEHLRANRIEQELLKDGVDDHQVAIAPEAFEAGHNPAKDSGLEVVLTNRT
jgi:hypothetical protein